MSDWRKRAACVGEDPERFFPLFELGGRSTRMARIEYAAQISETKAICRRCEVRDDCLESAMESGERDGIWGGLTVDERRALGRRRVRAGAR